MSFNELIGKTLIAINGAVGDEQMIFICNDGDKYRLYHQQDCCERVSIDDIVGDLADLLNVPILAASEDSNNDNPKLKYGTNTWTFYNIRTIKGSVTIKWYGESNGYYSESVDFERI